MQLALRPRLLDLWSYGPGQLGAMVCEEADDGSGDLELEQYQAKDSESSRHTSHLATPALADQILVQRREMRNETDSKLKERGRLA